jgi:hypothetical protein
VVSNFSLFYLGVPNCTVSWHS